MIQILKARTDPRLAAYFDANAQGQSFGADQNNATVRAPGCPAIPPPGRGAAVSSVGHQYVRPSASTFRQPMVTWPENQLILAEAKFKTGIRREG